MKLFNAIATSAAVVACLFTAEIPAQAFWGANPLIGTWECKLTMRGDEGLAKLEYRVTYSRNNTYNSLGNISILINDIDVEMTYRISDTGNWYTKPGNIVESKNIDFRMSNTTFVPGATYQQNIAFRDLVDKEFPAQKIFGDIFKGGVYEKIRFSKNNNRFKLITEGERDWENASVCNRI